MKTLTTVDNRRRYRKSPKQTLLETGLNPQRVLPTLKYFRAFFTVIDEDLVVNSIKRMRYFGTYFYGNTWVK